MIVLRLPAHAQLAHHMPSQVLHSSTMCPLLGELVQGGFNLFLSENGPSCPLRPAEGKEDIQEYYLTAFLSARGMVEVQCVSMKNAYDREDAEGAQHASVEWCGLTRVREHPCLCVHTHGKESGKRQELDAQDSSRHIWVDTSMSAVSTTTCSLIPLSFRYAANVVVYPHGEWFKYFPLHRELSTLYLIPDH